MSNRLNLLSTQMTQDFNKAQLRTKYLAEPLEFMNLGALLPPALNAQRKALRVVLERELAPLLAECTEKAAFPSQCLRVLRPLRLFGLSQAKYGCPSISPLLKSLYLYELGRLDSSLATFYVVTMNLVIRTLESLGSEEQQAKYLPPLVNVEKTGCWGLTEPGPLQMTAAPVNGGFLLNGTKEWVVNASSAEILIVFAQNTRTRQVEGFILNSGAAGVHVEPTHNKLALRVAQDGTITLTDAFVPLVDRLEKTKDIGPNLILEHSQMTLA